jgi:hypothetical protein
MTMYAVRDSAAANGCARPPRRAPYRTAPDETLRSAGIYRVAPIGMSALGRPEREYSAKVR